MSTNWNVGPLRHVTLRVSLTLAGDDARTDEEIRRDVEEEIPFGWPTVDVVDSDEVVS